MTPIFVWALKGLSNMGLTDFFLSTKVTKPDDRYFNNEIVQFVAIAEKCVSDYCATTQSKCLKKERIRETTRNNCLPSTGTFHPCCYLWLLSCSPTSSGFIYSNKKTFTKMQIRCNSVSFPWPCPPIAALDFTMLAWLAE